MIDFFGIIWSSIFAIAIALLLLGCESEEAENTIVSDECDYACEFEQVTIECINYFVEKEVIKDNYKLYEWDDEILNQNEQCIDSIILTLNSLNGDIRDDCALLMSTVKAKCDFDYFNTETSLPKNL